MRKIVHVLTAAAVTLAALVITADPARADVIVPPRQSGHICSNYSSITSQIKWQTCAWADNNELYFTVNFANNSSMGLFVDRIDLGYVANGAVTSVCHTFTNFYAPSGRTSQTDTAVCAFPRTRAYATQAQARVVETYFGSYNVFQRSDSLQAQY
ncbi:hypothetical protein AB0J66_38600 [Actinoplanes sp. NPDC049598]